jgi:glyoxylase-like metal-dependent hydrolase (beta-lactamase superfamily II)
MKTTLVKYLLPVLVLGSAQLMANEMKLQSTPVRGNIHLIQGAGGNVAASIGDDGILVVDSFVKGVTDKLTLQLAKLAPDAKLKFLLNTHWHGDHTGGNAQLSAQVPVIAHDNVRERLMNAQKNYFGASPASPKEAWPVLTFNDAMTVHFNGETIQVKHYPGGHTDGDSMVYFVNANVLHMGDDYFQGMYPFVDLTTGGSVVGLAKNIGKVLQQMPEDVVIIPGHGKLSNLKELKAYHQMLKTSIEIVKKGIAEGKSLAQIQHNGLGESLSAFGKGFIPEKSWIEFTYQSIKAEHGHKTVHKHNGSSHHH